jgi:hypothetical protein
MKNSSRILAVCYFALALLLGACEFPQPVCDCVPERALPGSVLVECGPAGGTVLAIRFDLDSTVTGNDRKYRLYPIFMDMDTIKGGSKFKDTVQICENSVCRSHALRISIDKADSSFLVGDFQITDITHDSSAFIAAGRIKLKKEPAPPAFPCI